MDEKQRMMDPEHPLQGPHQKWCGQQGNFTPLHLILKPDETPVVLTRADMIIGRHTQADIRLVLPEVSRRHCRLVFEDGVWKVHDLNSLNGLFLNGERVQEATLYEGDSLRVGSFTFLVEKGATPRNGATLDRDNPILQSIAKTFPPNQTPQRKAG